MTRMLVEMRDKGRSGWTQTAVLRIVKGVLALAEQEGLIVRSPAEQLSSAVRPKQRNAKAIRRLSATETALLVEAAGNERWATAIALAAYGGLRLGELRALRWCDIDFGDDVDRKPSLVVRASLTPQGERKEPKSEAGVRLVPMEPELVRELLAWQARSPWTRDDDPVICTAEGKPTDERNLRRALDEAKVDAGLSGGEQRLSWHSLRHSAGSFLVVAGLPITTVARMLGHSDPSFTLACYARDARDEAAFIDDVLERTAAARAA